MAHFAQNMTHGYNPENNHKQQYDETTIHHNTNISGVRRDRKKINLTFTFITQYNKILAVR